MVHLLIDYITQESTVHSEPDAQRFRTVTTKAFGETITFSFPGGTEAVIDTSVF